MFCLELSLPPNNAYTIAVITITKNQNIKHRSEIKYTTFWTHNLSTNLKQHYHLKPYCFRVIP